MVQGAAARRLLIVYARLVAHALIPEDDPYKIYIVPRMIIWSLYSLQNYTQSLRNRVIWDLGDNISINRTSNRTTRGSPGICQMLWSTVNNMCWFEWIPFNAIINVLLWEYRSSRIMTIDLYNYVRDILCGGYFHLESFVTLMQCDMVSHFKCVCGLRGEL